MQISCYIENSAKNLAGISDFSMLHLVCGFLYNTYLMNGHKITEQSIFKTVQFELLH